MLFKTCNFLCMNISVAVVGGSKFLLLSHRCDIPWYPMIVTEILRFFVITAYALATSPGHLSQLLYFCCPPLFVALSLS
jgi:hypothetical protein